MRRTVFVWVTILLWAGSVRAQIPTPGTAPVPPGVNSSASPGINPLPGAYPAPTQLPPNLMGPFATVPGPAPAARDFDNLMSFDYHLLDLKWLENRWQLYAGGLWLKDFGSRQAEAREALRILRELRVNQHGTLGSPRPVLEYWLVDGKAPQAFPGGLRLLPIDRTTLRVEQIQGQWCLRDGQRLLFAFGSHQNEAQQALDLIRRHGFSQVGYVGQPVPAMLYFLANNPGGMASGTLTAAETTSPPAATRSGQTPEPPVAPANPAAQFAANIRPAAFAQTHQLSVPQVGGLTGAKDRVAFDPRQVQIRRDGVDWKLYYGAYALANFGSSDLAQAEARQALSAVQFYRFTEQDLVGDQPGFSYFLTNGKAPQGLLFGVRNEAFRPATVNVRQLGSSYLLCDEDRPLLNFGARGEEAQRVVQAIKQYQFDHLCRVGHEEGKSMVFFIQAR